MEIFNVEDKTRPLFRVGRWWAQDVITGDGSGGNIGMAVPLMTAADLFGQNILFDLRYYTLWTNFASNGGTLAIQGGEYANQPEWQFTMGSSILHSGEMRSYEMLVPKYLFRIATRISGSINPGQVTITTAPNGGANAIVVTMGGYLFDERYMMREAVL
jgi:hypothetical protein